VVGGSDEGTLSDAALKKICTTTCDAVVIANLAESTAFDKLCAYGCVKRSESQSRDGFGYKLTDEGRSFYHNGGFTREQLMKDNIEASVKVAHATVNMVKFQRKIAIITIGVAVLTYLVLAVQIFLHWTFNKPSNTFAEAGHRVFPNNINTTQNQNYTDTHQVECPKICLNKFDNAHDMLN
jgi:hypothetical protein